MSSPFELTAAASAALKIGEDIAAERLYVFPHQHEHNMELCAWVSELDHDIAAVYERVEREENMDAITDAQVQAVRAQAKLCAEQCDAAVQRRAILRRLESGMGSAADIYPRAADYRAARQAEQAEQEADQRS
jgi:hypothetical protein